MDRSEFDALLLANLDAAARFAVRLTGRIDLAQDVTQDAITRASQAWRSFAGRASFKTWLFRIVLNQFRDHGRKQARRPMLRLTNDATVDVDPTGEARARELGERIAARVSALPPRQREVLVLVAYEQIPQADAARILGMNEQTLRTTLHQARAALKSQLDELLRQQSER